VLLGIIQVSLGLPFPVSTAAGTGVRRSLSSLKIKTASRKIRFNTTKYI
jgi:hypothetical protein